MRSWKCRITPASFPGIEIASASPAAVLNSTTLCAVRLRAVDHNLIPAVLVFGGGTQRFLTVALFSHRPPQAGCRRAPNARNRSLVAECHATSARTAVGGVDDAS